MSQMRRFVRRCLLRVAFIVALLTGLVAAAGALDRTVTPLWPEIPEWSFVSALVLWTAALGLALPPLLASANKLKAAAVLAAEVGVTPTDSPRRTRATRAAVAAML